MTHQQNSSQTLLENIRNAVAELKAEYPKLMEELAQAGNEEDVSKKVASLLAKIELAVRQQLKHKHKPSQDS